MITAAVHRRWTGDVEIDDHIAANLPIPSVVRTAKIATIPATVAERLGTLPRAPAAEITQILRQRLPIG